MRRAAALAGLLAAFGAVSPGLALGTTAEPFQKVIPGGKGLQCTTADGYEGEVRFCPGNGDSERVPSWDGVPLDVDVTLPPAADGEGPFPTIVMLHGYGSSKTEFESKKAEGEGSGAAAAESYDYNNDYFAQHGYAVVNYTARGFGDSCGGVLGKPNPSSQIPACEEHGFIHLADQRYEARDTQYLLGILVDEGIAAADGLGVTGISYGGGQSTELAYLKNRIRCAGPGDPYDGPGNDPCEGAAENALVPWKTPLGQELEIKAAYARWPWSDLVSALVPNGRFLDDDPATDGQDGATGTNSPIGVPIKSYLEALYLEGELSGTYEPLTGNPEWNLTADFGLLTKVEPENPQDQAVIDMIAAFHGGWGIPGTPAPLLMESGWNDDLFPPAQALRVYNSVRETDPSADVALQFGDVGHSRGTNKQPVDEYFNDQGVAFFAEKLKGLNGEELTTSVGKASSPQAGSVTTFTTTCPSNETAPDGGPYTANSWTALQGGSLSFTSLTPQTLTSPASAQDELLNKGFDPITQEEKGSLSEGACTTAPTEETPGNASYVKEATGSGFTLMGLPTISADVQSVGIEHEQGELDGRLWDLLPSGQQRLVSRGAYRLAEGQTDVTFQLHGNGYHFAGGDKLKVELTSSESPYYYADPAAIYSVLVKSIQVTLPTYEASPSPLGSVEEPVAKEEKPAAKEETQPTKSEAPSQETGTSPSKKTPQCTSRRLVRIRLPHYRNGRIVRVVITLAGHKVARIGGHSLKAVSYRFKAGRSGSNTLKLTLTVRRGHHKALKPVLTRRFLLCKAR